MSTRNALSMGGLRSACGSVQLGLTDLCSAGRCRCGTPGSGRCDRQPGRRLGHSAGSQPVAGAGAGGAETTPALSAARSRREVLPELRRCVPLRGCRGALDARAGAQGRTHSRSAGCGTVRTECLDWLLIVSRGHLEQVLRVYVRHYNDHCPHRALRLQPPDQPGGLMVVGKEEQGRVHRRDLLGGLLHEYRHAA